MAAARERATERVEKLLQKSGAWGEYRPGEAPVSCRSGRHTGARHTGGGHTGEVGRGSRGRGRLQRRRVGSAVVERSCQRHERGRRHGREPGRGGQRPVASSTTSPGDRSPASPTPWSSRPMTPGEAYASGSTWPSGTSVALIESAGPGGPGHQDGRTGGTDATTGWRQTSTSSTTDDPGGPVAAGTAAAGGTARSRAGGAAPWSGGATSSSPGQATGPSGRMPGSVFMTDDGELRIARSSRPFRQPVS